MILRLPINWNQDDVVHSRDFIASSTGQKWLLSLKASVQKIDVGANKDVKYDQSLVMQTQDAVINAMAAFAVDVEQKSDEPDDEIIDFSTHSNKPYGRKENKENERSVQPAAQAQD